MKQFKVRKIKIISSRYVIGTFIITYSTIIALLNFIPYNNMCARARVCVYGFIFIRLLKSIVHV